MSGITLLFKNLGRNRTRTVLTVLAIALPMFVFTVARSFVDLFHQFLVDSDKNMRVAVHQKLTFTASLPQRLRGEIEGLAPEGYVTAICRTSWFGGRVEGSQVRFGSMGVDRDTFHRVYSEYEMSPEEVERFANERRGAVVSKQLADQMNWNVGDHVTLIGSLPPFPEVEFQVAAIPSKMPRMWLVFGLDYYDEIYQQKAGGTLGVNNFWLKCASPQARRWALTEVDKHFANSEHETRAEMESTFIAAFVRSGGDWIGMIWTIGQLIVLVAVSVAFNTMSMAFRERTRELAVMRAVGFSAGWIMRLVLLEGLLLGGLGGAIAVVPIYSLTSIMPLSLPDMNLPIHIAGPTAGIALSVALACGVLAAIIPAFMAGRLRVAPALRRVV